jgi:nucleoside-diphosphate-sugar epimerase
VRDLVEIARPDVVFNLAGYGVDRAERDPAAMQALNAELVGHVCGVLAAAERATAWGGLRLVHVGSALEYGQWAGPLSEDVAAAPTTDYGWSKLAGTEHVLHFGRAGHPASVARLFNVYGPGEHPDRLLPTIERAARTASRVPLSSGTQSRDFTYVEDVAEGLLRLALEPMASGMVVHLATGRLTSVREFAETAADVLGLPRSALDFGAMPDRDVELHHGPVDIGRLRRILGWAPPTPLADGLRRSWEFAYA